VTRPRSQTVTVIPSARRLVTSLRDVGYDFVHAIADLIDNSITANATEVNIVVRFEGPDSWVRVADNGEGMTGGEITEAMRYGAQRGYGVDDLGKFGLGLKTASLSQCRQLSVASRTHPTRRQIECRRFDLDRVEASDTWEVEVLAAVDRPSELVEPLQNGPGTVVLLRRLDRVLEYKVPWGERARTGLYDLAERLDLHLGMVFHRFLAGEVRRRPRLTITVNGTKVEPWDPFARNEPATESLPAIELDVVTPGCSGLVRLEPWVLPPRDAFSSPRAFERLAGPAKWNQQQGLYVYRANRLIQSGGWNRLRAADEHTKLARAALEFFPDLDPAFEINIAKMRVNLPGDLRDKLKNPVEHLVRRAQVVYRQGQRRPPTPSPPAPSPTPASPRRGRPAGTPPPGQPAPPGQAHLRRALEGAAVAVGEEEALARIVAQLRSADPGAARDIGWG
jgi:hypothetical protein